jgi:site-specific recombinase XerD
MSSKAINGSATRSARGACHHVDVTTDSFNWMVKRAGQKAEFPFQVHAHMLRHAAGYKLAGDGHDTRSIQDYLGHKNIQHTVRYTELSPTRFKDFWRD